MFLKPGCIPTSTSRITIDRRRATAGRTLVELLFTMGVGGLVLSAIASFVIYTGRSLAGMVNYVDLEQQTCKALDYMSRDIRLANELTDFTTNRLAFVDANPTNQLIFQYSPANRTLIRVKEGQTNTLLTGCDSLAFSIYQRNTMTNSFDQYPTSLAASNTKVIQVTWLCSRTITGTRLNTELVQTAKIVIRNQ